MPTAQNSVDSSSSSTRTHCPSDAATPIDATPSIGKSSSGSSLVGSILDAYGKEILESANDEFLDLAVEMRLQTIGERELVNLLAEARRLGYQKTDIIDEESDRPVQVAGSPSKPNAIATPKPLGTIAGRYRPLSTASSQSPSLEESRAPKRTNTVKVRRDESLLINAHLNAPDVHKSTTSEKEGGYSILNIQGVVDIQDRMSTAIGVAKKRGQRQRSRIGSGPRVGAHVAKSSNVLKRTRAQLTQDVRGGVQSRHPKNPLPTSIGKPSSSTRAQLPEIVVIDDSEPEPEDDDDN